LYANQRDVGPDAVAAAAREVGGVTDFDGEYARVLSLVKQDADKGGRLAIQGTPTFFINGVRIEGAPRAEYLDAAIAHELRRAGVMTE
jgi:protein-disulfide isomerase